MSRTNPSSPAILEAVVLLDRRGRKTLVPLAGDTVQAPGLGVFATKTLRESLGRRVTVGGASLIVLRPSARDLAETIERRAQVLTDKDLAAILFAADIGPGAHVVEAGSGSGALSVVLASAVGREGRVVSYDVRDEFLQTARSNAARAGVASRIEFRTGDVRLGINEVDLDAVVLDIPDPWAAVQAAWDALRPCGHLACFSPNMEQVKETVAAIRARPFVDVYTLELIERQMEVRDVGVRPSFAPLGHTGYLTFARKVLEGF